MATVQVTYTVEVSAFVDLEDERVERVCVWDEEISGPKSVMDAEFADTVDAKMAERAKQIAENAAWPGWQWGA